MSFPTSNNTIGYVSGSMLLLAGQSVPASAQILDYLPQRQLTHVGQMVDILNVASNPTILAWSKLQNRVESWTELDHDWDGDDGIPLSRTTADSAIAFLQSASLTTHPVPTPYIAGDGEVGFRWTAPGNFTSVSFLDDGHIVAYVRVGEAVKFTMDREVGNSFNYSQLLNSLALNSQSFAFN